MIRRRWAVFVQLLGNTDAGWRGVAATLLATMTVVAALALTIAGVVFLSTANPYAGMLLLAGIVAAAFLLITRGAQ